MKRFAHYALFGLGFFLLWAAVGDVPLLSPRGLFGLFAGLFISMGSSIGTARTFGRWPWEAPTYS